MPIQSRPAYQGQSRKLVIAFDIGTTFSGASYAYLDPDNVPGIRPVTRFPAQEHVGADTKIPSVLYYNQDGELVAVGAATLKEGIEADAEENGWVKAHWWKLRLRAETSADLKGDSPLPPLPSNKSVVDVFADYMKYLYQCTKTYVTDTHGGKLWESLEGDIAFVFTHPNGWGGPEQAKMRQAAILAGLIPDTAGGRDRVHFVTEGEASLHFCLSNGLEVTPTSDEGSQASGVIIVDAGGGTIDVTTYRRISDKSFEEIAVPRCYLQGAAYVAMRAGKYIAARLDGTRFEQDVPTIVARFDRTTKHVFRRQEEPHHIQFASFRERDPALNIRGGRITIEGDVVAQSFEPSIDCIVEAIEVQQSTAHFPVQAVFLVGGFSASDWLYENVKERVEPLGITVSRPDTHVNKAVANGAVSFYLDGAVTSRVARSTYGIRVYRPYNPCDLERFQRAHLTEVHETTGVPALFGGFSSILLKDTRVDKSREFRQHYRRDGKSASDLDSVVADILYYTGENQDPRWVSDEPDMFPTICSIEADTSRVKKVARLSTSGDIHYTMSYDIILLFGLTELKAQIAYTVDGVEKRGPATVLYDGVVYQDPSLEEEGTNPW